MALLLHRSLHSFRLLQGRLHLSHLQTMDSLSLHIHCPVHTADWFPLRIRKVQKNATVFYFHPVSSNCSDRFHRQNHRKHLHNLIPHLSLDKSSSFFHPDSVLLHQYLLHVCKPIPALLRKNNGSGCSFLYLRHVRSHPMSSISPTQLLHPVSPHRAILGIPHSKAVGKQCLTFHSLLEYYTEVVCL